MNRVIVTAAVLACAGCAVSGGSNRGVELRQDFHAEEGRTSGDVAASRADEAAGRTSEVTASATALYWSGLKAALKPRPINPKVVARDIASLPVLGVDPDLVREGQLAAEKMRSAADSVRSISAFVILFHFPRSQLAEAEALSRAAVDQCWVIERMRPELVARHGVEFPPLDLPTP